ncbi:hypothetical protein FOMPIDRAFT_92879 [Fomitopsis schrenkii]|uniref:Uncharacterized protein n=1 Tax=Fomitopsis schrenkii TaxID=2126942 RepID=S8DTV4_FOMSC|nr:hypothetical protein FOMPIDRAFT_92879 [Fomitopsis schrenkii]
MILTKELKQEIVHASILNELDTTKDFEAQDEEDLKRHFAEVERTWTNASKYDGAWPVLDYTKHWLAANRALRQPQGTFETAAPDTSLRPNSQ